MRHGRISQTIRRRSISQPIGERTRRDQCRSCAQRAALLLDLSWYRSTTYCHADPPHLDSTVPAKHSPLDSQRSTQLRFLTAPLFARRGVSAPRCAVLDSVWHLCMVCDLISSLRVSGTVLRKSTMTWPAQHSQAFSWCQQRAASTDGVEVIDGQVSGAAAHLTPRSSGAHCLAETAPLS